MKVSYYPGCSLEGTAADYAASIAAITPLMDVELAELEDWNCCGASAAHSINHQLSLELPARNLALARKTGLDLVVPCALCFNRLKAAEKAEPRPVQAAAPANGGKVWDLLEFLTQKSFLDVVRKKTVRPLFGLKAVGYYGCLASRPPDVTDKADYENPEDLEHLLQVLQAEPLDWSYKTDCCGAGLAMSRPDLIDTLVGRLYDRALAARGGVFCGRLSDVPGEPGPLPGAHRQEVRQDLLPAGVLFHRADRPGPGTSGGGVAGWPGI